MTRGEDARLRRSLARLESELPAGRPRESGALRRRPRGLSSAMKVGLTAVVAGILAASAVLGHWAAEALREGGAGAGVQGGDPAGSSVGGRPGGIVPTATAPVSSDATPKGAPTASAPKKTVFMWTDEKGGVHATDQLGAVPEDRRGTVHSY